MAFRDSWHRALVYFGLAEERDMFEEEETGPEPEVELEDRYRERPGVRRAPSGRGRGGRPPRRGAARPAAAVEPAATRRDRRHLRRRRSPGPHGDAEAGAQWS